MCNLNVNKSIIWSLRRLKLNIFKMQLTDTIEILESKPWLNLNVELPTVRGYTCETKDSHA